MRNFLSGKNILYSKGAAYPSLIDFRTVGLFAKYIIVNRLFFSSNGSWAGHPVVRQPRPAPEGQAQVPSLLARASRR
jgi:hypothetical protein